MRGEQCTLESVIVHVQVGLARHLAVLAVVGQSRIELVVVVHHVARSIMELRLD